jgi:hypothetical protein
VPFPFYVAILAWNAKSLRWRRHAAPMARIKQLLLSATSPSSQ